MFRNPMRMGRWIVIAVAIGLVCSSAALAKKPDKPPGGDSGAAYSIVPFFTPVPPPNLESVNSLVLDLNDLGYAVGYEEFQEELDDGSHQTVRWALYRDMATATYTRLQDCYTALGVNNLSQVVGERLDGERRVGAFWKAPDDAAPFDLPLLSTDTDSAAEAINDAGIIVGNDDGGIVWRVFVDEDGDVSVDGPVPLPPLDGDTLAWGSDLNELVDGSFQVTGLSRGEVGPPEAAVWTVAVNADGTLATPGPPVSLGTLGLYDPSRSSSSAINTLGDVCGTSDGMPFVAPAGQTAQPLPVPRNTHSGLAFDINNLGEIVGRLTILIKGGAYAPMYAYLWKDGDAINLKTQIDRKSGWGSLWSANVINDAGIIAGFGRFDVESRGFLLIPSEP